MQSREQFRIILQGEFYEASEIANSRNHVRNDNRCIIY